MMVQYGHLYGRSPVCLQISMTLSIKLKLSSDGNQPVSVTLLPSHMFTQIHFDIEAFATKFTAKWFFSGMNEAVLCQVILLAE